MRILIITEFFDPEPTIKGLSFAQALAERGHEVQVLTGFPNYPGGRVYPGYRIRPVQREQHGVVEVIRVALFPSHDRSALRRIATYASFAASAAITGMAVTKRPDVVYAYHPPATVGLAAMAHASLRRVPFVYDIQDLWPDTLRATGMITSGGILTVVDWWCQRIYAAAARIAVLSPGFREQLVARGVPAQKIDVIYNWTNEERNPPASAGEPLPHFDGFTVLFAGTMGLAQDLDVVMHAAEILAGSEPPVRFAMMGGGPDRKRLELECARRRLSNVVFLPPRPMHQMHPALESADALLIHLKDDPLFRITIPSKTQAYLAAGRPILIGVLGDARQLVESAAAGLPFHPGDAADLANAIRRLASLPASDRDAMGRRGRAYYERHLSLARGIDAFDRILHEATKPTR